MSTVDNIKARVRIGEVLARCGLQTNNSGFIFSPYREEKTPSCKIYFKTDSFYDFSEGKGGDVIDLWALLYKVEKKAAIQQLAQLIGEGGTSNAPAPPPLQKKQTAYKPEELFTPAELEMFYERLGITDNEEVALRFVKEYRMNQNSEVLEAFASWCIARGGHGAANHYLTSKRLLDPAVLKKFRVFTIPDYSQANQYLKSQFPLTRLQKAGLYNDKGNLIFWRYRIMIPYLFRGKIVYLRGRYFEESEVVPENTGKYIGLRDDGLGVNSPKRFYNWDVVSTMRPGEKIYIVEGEFDAMMVESIGYNCIGIPGTGTANLDRLKYLGAFDVVIMTDTDEAGKKLKGRLLRKFAELGIKVSTKDLPAKDVTDFVVKHA